MDKFLMSSPQLLQPFPDEDDQVYYDYDLADISYDEDAVRGHAKHFSVDGRQFDLLAPFLLNAGSRFNFNHLRNVSLDDLRYGQDEYYDEYGSFASYDGAHAPANMNSGNAHPNRGITGNNSGNTGMEHAGNTPETTGNTGNASTHLDNIHTGNMNAGSTGANSAAPGTSSLNNSASTIGISNMGIPDMDSLASNIGMDMTSMASNMGIPGQGHSHSNNHGHNHASHTFAPGHSHRVSQSDPPITVTHLTSLLTLHLLSSVPPLLLLALNPLLQELPYLAIVLTTPARRRKCSVLSITYATPLRGLNPLPSVKVGKTPLTHRRTRLRAKHLDSFDSLTSPHALDFETPAKRNMPQYFTPVLSFGGLLERPLRRNDTLDLIKIEDQDDDACKQLRKAKSFMGYLTFSTSGGNLSANAAANGGSANGLSYALFGNIGGRFRKSASIDLLSPELVTSERSKLKKYPASIDLAAITNSAVTTSPHTTGGLLPPITATRVRTSPPHSSYPTSSQIQETSTTLEIAKFAEEILKSDLKRPIVVQADDDDDPKKKHKCPLCLARFQRPEHVKRHLKSHSTEKPYQCDVPDCGRRFNRKDNLKAHLKKIHKRVD